MQLPSPPTTSIPEDIQKWAEQITAYLGDPDIQLLRTIGGQTKTFTADLGDVNGGNYFSTASNGNLSLIGTADRLWTAQGGLYLNDAANTLVWGVSDAGVWYDVDTLVAGGNPTRVTENAATGELTVINAGMYLIGFHMSTAASAGLTLHGDIATNSGGGYVRRAEIACRRDIGSGGVYGDFSAHFPYKLAAGEKVKLQVQSDTASRTLTIDHVQLWVVRVAE